MKLKENKLVQTGLRNRYSLLAFVASAFIMIIVFYCFDVIPFGDSTVLRMDLYHQYGPLFAELYDRITSGESLLYSWNSGLGSGFLGNFGNYLSSPLAVVMLICGHKNMPEAIAIMILLKSAFASAFFSYYLRKSTDKDGFLISAFGVLYSFCGFFIAYYWNIMWIDAMALFPLVMLGIEQIIKNGKFKLYLFSLAVVMISNYYMAYIVCIFSVIYFIAFYFAHYSITDRFKITKFVDENGNSVKKKGSKNGLLFTLRNSRFFNSGLRFAVSSVAAAGIAAALLLPVGIILQNSSATSDTFPSELKITFKIFDFIANHLNSVDPTIRSSGVDVLPNVYCGIISAMLAPLFLYSKHYEKREKASYVIILALLFISFNFNIINFIWHGFHSPNDLPYRLSYIYSFVLLVMAFKALSHIEDYNPKILLTTGIASLAFIIITQELGSKNVSDETIIISVIFVVLYTLVTILMNSGKYQASALALLLFCCVVSEAAIGNTSHYVMQQPKTNYTNDYDKFVAVKRGLDEKENGQFYRMELTDLRTRMDPCWYDYNGVSVFSSMAYESTSNLINYLGVDGNFINSYTYNGFQTPVFNMMTSLKYIVDNTSSTPTPPESLYKKHNQISKFKTYENNYYLNIGYCVNNSLLGWLYSDSNPFLVQNDYFERATGIENVFTPVSIDSVVYNNVNDFFPGYETGDLYFSRRINDSDASFTLEYTVTESKNYYLFIESDSVENVTVSYGETVYDHNFDSGHLVDIGFVKAGETIYVDVPIASGNEGYIDVFMNALDYEKFVKGYNILKQGELQIESFEETKIKGTVNAKEDCLFYTSIPYDESWQIYVDGVRISTEEMQECKIGNGFIGFYLEAGNHNIEMKYMPRGLIIGCAVTGVTIIALVLVLLILRKQKTVAGIINGYSNASTIETITVTNDGSIAANPQTDNTAK